MALQPALNGLAITVNNGRGLLDTPARFRRTDHEVDAILRSVKRIAVVGASANPGKFSYDVIRALRERGYEVAAVNPTATVKSIAGAPVYAALADIPHPIDMVEVFRPSAELPLIAAQAIAQGAGVLWGQLDVYDEQAGDTAAAAGLEVVMDRCPKIEFQRWESE